MKLTYVVYIIFSSLSLIINPYTLSGHNLDSLKNLLDDNYTANKTEIYSALSMEYFAVSKEISFNYAREAINEALSENDTSSIAEAYKGLGNIHYMNKSIDSAIFYNLNSLKIYMNLRDTSGMSKVLNNLGIFYSELGDYEKAVKYHKLSLEYKTFIYDTAGIAYSCNNIGSIYYNLGDYNMAIEYFTNAKNISEKMNNDKGVHSANMNIGLALNEKSEFDLAIKHFDETLRYCIIQNDIVCISDCYTNIADSYIYLKEYKLALEYLMKAININNSYSLNTSSLLLKVGIIYAEKGDSSKAEDYFKIGIEKAKTEGDDKLYLSINKRLSEHYASERKWENAYLYLFDAYEISLKETIPGTTQTAINKNDLRTPSVKEEINDYQSDFLRKNKTVIIALFSLVFLLLIYFIISKLKARK